MLRFLVCLMLLPVPAFAGSIAPTRPDAFVISESGAHIFLSSALRKALKNVPADAIIIGDECVRGKDGVIECVFFYVPKRNRVGMEDKREDGSNTGNGQNGQGVGR